MKKVIVLFIVLVGLAGCGSSSSKETNQSGKNTDSTSTANSTTSATKTSSSEKKIELQDVDFEVEGTNYKAKILNSWKVFPNEDASFEASTEDETEGMTVYGLKKTDIDGIESFKNLMKEEMVSDDEFQIKEETIKEYPFQTTHYSGEFYSFIVNSEGVNTETCFYFFETETEYIVLSFFGFPSFFDKNSDLVTEMVNSFVAA